MKAIVRVILATVGMMTLVNAGPGGWFSGDEDGSRDGRRGGRPQEDYVEPQPDGYGEPASRKGGRGRKARARSRDEMMSKEYNDQILRDDTIEETRTPESNEDGYLSDEDINKIWAEHMHDFVPEDMMNAIVETRTTEALFEVINHETPTKIKGAYYVLNGNQEKTVDCMVYDPNRELLYKRKGSAQGILIFDSTIPGEYAIIFSNQQSGVDLTVTLALHTYEDKEEQVQYDITEDGKRVKVGGDAGEETEALTNDQISAAVGGEENMAATDAEVGGVKRMLREIQT